MARTDQPLVKAEHIVKHFPIRGGVFLRRRVRLARRISGSSRVSFCLGACL